MLALMRILLASGLISLLLIATAQAANEPWLAQGNTMVTGEQTKRAPYGWATLCGTEPKECNVYVEAPVDLRLTQKTWETLQKVNKAGNAVCDDKLDASSSLSEFLGVPRTAKPKRDKEFVHMAEYWDYPKNGKCFDASRVLWKRKKLMDLGVPRQALLLTFAGSSVKNSAGRSVNMILLVLTVTTDHGDLILSDADDPIPLKAFDFQLVKRQSQSDPNVWQKVSSPAAGAK